MVQSRKTSAQSKKAKSEKLSQQNCVVIVGCNGHIGKNVLRHLETQSRYTRVVAIDAHKPSITLKKTQFYKLDLTATMADAALADILKEVKCDTLIHTAMPASPMRNESLAHELTAIGSYYIFNACAAAKVRKVVMASTTDVYGAHPENPNFLSEQASLRGRSQNRFIADKIDAENQALKFQKKHPESVVTILRNTMILGPTIESFKTRYLQRPFVMTMLGFDPLLQFVHEEDALNAFVQAIDHDHAGIFNVGADGVLPLSRVIQLCGGRNMRVTQTVFKTTAQLLWMADISPAPSSYADFLRYPCVVDNRRLKSTFDFEFRYNTKQALLSFTEALRLKRINLNTEEAA